MFLLVKYGSHDKSERKYERDDVPILQRQSDMSFLKPFLPSSTYKYNNNNGREESLLLYFTISMVYLIITDDL